MTRIGKPIVRVVSIQPVIPRLFSFLVPITTKSLGNQREHWRRRAERNQGHRAATFLCFPREARELLSRKRWPRCVVTMTRIGRELDDDNLAGALKSVRDELAKQLGVDDRDPRIAFICKQRPGPVAGVEVKLERHEAKQPLEG